MGPPVTAGSATGSALPDAVRSTVEQFVHQLRTVSGAGGGVATDPVILSLYQTLNALHPQLLKQIDDIQQQKSECVCVCYWCDMVCVLVWFYAGMYVCGFMCV